MRKNLSDEEWARIIAVSLTGVFYCMREALKIMEAKKYGKIINISSIAGVSGLSFHGPHIMRRLTYDVFPAFGHRSIDDIKATDIRSLILQIEDRGARDVAQRQYGTISQIFRYAVTHDLAERDPAADFKPSDVLSPRKTQHRAHIEPSGLPTLLVAIENYDDKIVVPYALKLMCLLFVRSSELSQAPWSEFDLDSAVWKITPERMKMSKPHIVP